MTRRLRNVIAYSLALAVPAVVAGTPGHSQDESGLKTAPGTSGAPAASRNPEARAWTIRVIRRLSECLVGDHPRVAQAIADLPLSSSDDSRRAAVRRFHEINRCTSIATGWHHRVHQQNSGYLRGNLHGNLRLLAGSLAETLYLRRHASLPILGTLEPAQIAAIDDLPARITYLIADCLIDRDSAGADRLLRSDVETSAEREAFLALSNHFSACLDAGNRLGVDRYNLRAALAELLYRRSAN